MILNIFKFMEAEKSNYNSNDFRTKSMWTKNRLNNLFRDKSANGRIILEFTTRLWGEGGKWI